MPRQPDPELEDRILNAAQALWTRGGEKSLTMRAVARAAGTNTPTVYRRFKDRRDLIRGVLRRTVVRLRTRFEVGGSLEAMAEAYIDEALRLPHDYELFYAYGYELLPAKGIRAAAADPGVEAKLRISGSATGKTAGRFARGSHAAGAGAVGDSAWHGRNYCWRDRSPRGMRKSCAKRAGRRSER